MPEASIYIPNQTLKDAAKHGELVVFVGAGASMLCGSPDWRGFANQVVGALEKGGVLSFLETEQLRGLGDSRRTLSIAMALAKEKGIAIDFDSILHPTKPAAIGSDLYELLSSLRPVFVTTNYDKWLDDVGPEDLSTEVKIGGEAEPAKGPSRRAKYYLREHLSPALLAERGAVIHLHGTYTDPSSMVVSLKDYIEHYADPKVQAFLSAMFKNHTVLFVGYGLAELEVLDHIIRSNESLRTGAAEPRHFLLYAYRSTETVQTRFVEHFFRDQCGVCVVPYCIDAKGYQEVVEVFKGWNSELDVRDPTTLDLQSHLDRCVASPTSVNREAALRLVRNRPELASYFVNSLKDVVWFSDLDSAGFFNVEHSPEVKVVESDRGTMYQAEGWPALRYLEQTSASAQGDQATRIAGIVRAISSNAQQRGLDNWRTWWSLATILSQLPLEVMTDLDVDMIRFWLSGRFESNMVGQELGEKLLPRLLDSSEPANWHRAMLLVDALSMVRRTGESS
ncbi:SIR2 family protein [Hydrogenophaga taeniospiralis]|uniref:SIR2 family protein n=1 Tax=Hydrogenophaga taeniospiralis TaxID=65656 RepID=UPI001CFA44AF|nr:SIR2 family protein [Hydrogenophaga taeniospiralis]UCU93391.1 SIR2 family protein [Hydrogenophaga taeniospiralis]